MEEARCISRWTCRLHSPPMGETREIYEEEAEVSLLDLLVVAAENLKLLVFGPVLIGLLALAISYALPQSFVSQSILALPALPQTPTQATAVMVSPLVLDPAIESLKLAKGRSMQIARAALATQINATVGKDGLVRLDVTASTPAAAQAIANAVIDNWLATTVPPARERTDLAARLAYAKGALSAVRGLLERLASESTSDLNKSLTRGESGLSIVAVGELQARYFSEVLTIPRILQGLSRDVIVQPPTLPTEPVAPKKSLIVLLAAFGSGFALLLWIFMRQSWKNAEQNPQAGEKQAKLLAAIRLSARLR